MYLWLPLEGVVDKGHADDTARCCVPAIQMYKASSITSQPIGVGTRRKYMAEFMHVQKHRLLDRFHGEIHLYEVNPFDQLSKVHALEVTILFAIEWGVPGSVKPVCMCVYSTSTTRENSDLYLWLPLERVVDKLRPCKKERVERHMYMYCVQTPS